MTTKHLCCLRRLRPFPRLGPSVRCRSAHAAPLHAGGHKRLCVQILFSVVQRRRSAAAAVLASAVLMHGCASNVPEAIRTPPPQEVTLAQARSEATDVAGREVRWGGVIATVENARAETRIEVVSRPLGSSGRPSEGDRSDGRFLARFSGFLDPAVYAEGRELTVRGHLDGVVTRAIGEYPYPFPVVDVETHQLWAPRAEPDPYLYDPLWYRPWYPDPWYPYPWSRYPYWW